MNGAGTAIRVLGPFALGYFLSYLFRVVNAVTAPGMVAELGLDASDLGLLTSAYFLGFASMQIPIGVALDRFGPRRTEAALLVLAALGAGVFAASDGVVGLVAGRAMIGAGVAACLMAAFKAFVIWFPSDRLPLVNGIQLASGGLGALAGAAPVQAALSFTDWRGISIALGLMAAVAALVVLRVVPEHPAAAPSETMRARLKGVSGIFASGAFWSVAPLTVASQATFLGVQTLWAGPWMIDAAGFSEAEAAERLSWIAAAMTVGFVGFGILGERLSRLGVPVARVALAGMVGFMAVQAPIALGEGRDAVGFWVAFGFFGTAGVLPYAALAAAFPAHMAGRVITALNLLVFAAAFAVQWAVGWTLDLWPVQDGGGYAPEGYRAAFLGLLVVQGLALPVWLLRERAWGAGRHLA